MGREAYNLKAAAEHVNVDANELKHAAQRGEIEGASEHGGDWWFEHRGLDEWAQRSLLAATKRELLARYDAMMSGLKREKRDSWRLAGLFREDAIDLAASAKTRGGMIRDMTDLAIASGLVYDDEGLYKELVAREEAAPTAVGKGAAFLHPRYHDPYFFEDTFVAYARAKRPVFFGAPDGEPTRHFFLICSTDHEQHLRILSRLAVLAHGTDLIERLDAAENSTQVIDAVKHCEDEIA
ncbi:MAG: PTS sugar transporter subunit IIA [Kiritimatiellae bacterium]|nr:PTS sugar transporter subunit IIA [Kiritimatiellia bacterium]